MDPFSTTASIITVLQLFSKVIKHVNGAAGATTERKRLREEVRSCESILQRLKDEADDADEGKLWSETINALEAPGAPLYRLRIALSVVIAKLEPRKGLKKALSALEWPFDEKEVEKAISTIEREKTLLALALTNDCRKLIQEIKKSSNENKGQLAELIEAVRESSKESSSQFTELKDHLGRVQGSQAYLKDGLDQLHDRQHNREATEKREAILDWLTPIDYAPQQSDFINRRQAGTGLWLLESTDFQEWMKTGKTLFCPGIPGAGKTILTSVVVDELNTRFQNDKSVGVAYLYCNFRRQDEQKAEDLLASLLKQLTQGQSSLPDCVKSLHHSHKAKRTRPSFNEISRTLQSVTTMYSRVFIIVDALDECQVSNGCWMRFLSEIFNLQAECQASLFATSRFIPEINEKFKESMSLEIRASNHDVQRYLDGHMSQLPGCVLRSSELQDKIKTEIIKAVDGIFLLAQLHLDSLKGKKSRKAIYVALKNLPTGSKAYNYAYKDAMERIEGQLTDEKELAKQALSWITYAKRPLTTSELEHALAVEAEEPQLDEENLCQVDDIISVCAGLVTVDEESDIVRLAHYTTQEYFERTLTTWFPNAHTYITKICVTYLSFDAFENGFCLTDEVFKERLQLHPFYNYAAQNRGHHARAASAEVEALILVFLKSEAKISASSQAMMAAQGHHYNGYSQRVPKQITGVHLAAYFGLGEVISASLRKEHDLDSKDKEGRTPLSWAAGKGDEAVVKLLLEHEGIDPDSKDTQGRTPLSWAAGKGHEAVVKLLLEHESVDPDSKDYKGRTPLSMAAGGGHQAVVKLLLEHEGIGPDSKDCKGRTPLSLAAWMGRGATVKLLLEHEGVDPDSKDYEGRTPLLWAAWSGDEVVVKLLLANDGVDPDSKDSKYGRTPLSWAAKQGHEAVVKLLLARDGVNPGSRDKFCRTPLSYAAGYGHEAVLKLLLVKNNVDLDIKDKFGLAPRSLAAKRGNPGIVQLLVEKHNENDKLIREEYMQVVNPPAGDHQNHIDCDVCMLSIPDRESHYHCRTCIDGDFDICQKCVASGYSCLDYSHKLVNRIVKDSTMVEVPD